ncbi:MAG TPA: hypothetical protein QGH10_01645 [Armatimonadota bacterium]|nr:hypothetical protein [Armatimonadota bacterium]
MRKAVDCPHCGAENSHSLIVTVCKACMGSLVGAQPRDIDLGGLIVPSAPPAPRPVGPLFDLAPETEIGVSALSEPPVAVAVIEPEPAETVTPGAARVRRKPSRKVRRASPLRDERTACPHCRYTNRVGALRCWQCRGVIAATREARRHMAAPCPQCGQVQDRRRERCYHCRLPFTDDSLQAAVVIERKPLSAGPTTMMDRVGQVGLGCAWMACGALLLTWLVISLMTR